MLRSDSRPTTSVPSSPRAAGRALVLGTVGFMVNFWAWNLISPLGVAYRDELGLTGFQGSVLVAVPVVVGSLGRIPVGALTDRIGARVMFPSVSLLTVVPVVFVGLVADTYVLLLIGGFFLGLGGTTFAIGVPLVNAWYPPRRRGTALGIFGVGMGGTAVAAFTTVPLTESISPEAPFLLVAALLVLYAVVAWVWLRDSPDRTPSAGSFLARTWATARLTATWQLSLIYAVGFGGFVAFSVYLPTYLQNAYHLSATDASLRTAGFVVLAVAMRPVGGWLSDRYGAEVVLAVSFLAASGLAALASAELELLPAGTVAFLGLAATLGATSGACFELVARLAPPGTVGSVTGIVGAAGGLGGFMPPLVMGAVYDATGRYALGLVLLAVVALGTAAFVWWPVRRAAAARADGVDRVDADMPERTPENPT